MPLSIASDLPTIFLRRAAFEQSGLARSEIDSRFNLTDAEFRVEGNLIALGPLPSDEMITPLIDYLEQKGLNYFEDFFEMSGNWPGWLRLVAVAS